MRILLRSVVTCAIASATVALLFAEINGGAAAIDSTSALRGSLGASLGDLSLSDNFGRLSLLLNGGAALLFAAFASLAVAWRDRDPISNRSCQGEERSAQSAHST
jgi:hypothetical protein